MGLHKSCFFGADPNKGHINRILIVLICLPVVKNTLKLKMSITCLV